MSLLMYLLQVTFSMAIFYSFYHLALRRETLFEGNRLYLLATLILSFLLPLLHFEWAPQVIQPVLMPAMLLGTSMTSLSEQLSPNTGSVFHLSHLLLTFYVAGMLWMTVKVLFAFRQIQLINKLGTPTTIQGFQCVLAEEVKAPFSFFRTIYLPLHHNYQDTELKEVIAHESAHVQDHHSWDVLLMELLTIVCWVNPFMYLYKNSLSDVHEYIADKAVLQFTHWENYAQLLVQQQYKQMPNALSHQLIYSQLKNRLKMMTRQSSARTARLKYIGIIPALFISLVLFSFTYGDVIKGAEQEPSSATVSVEEDIVMPRFPGCDKISSDSVQNCTSAKLNAYIIDNLVYPKSLKETGTQGVVVSKFTVGKDGRIKDPTIVRSFQADADMAVLNLIMIMNDKEGLWTPGTKDGKPVDLVMHLPVRFEYADE